VERVYPEDPMALRLNSDGLFESGIGVDVGETEVFEHGLAVAKLLVLCSLEPLSSSIPDSADCATTSLVTS
jgi:hypothetical protein